MKPRHRQPMDQRVCVCETPRRETVSVGVLAETILYRVEKRLPRK